MQRPLENFFRALRAADIRVSPAESIDAHRTVDVVGYGDRQLFKDALCVALAKTPDEVANFDECFEMFFQRDEFGEREDGDEDGEGSQPPEGAESDADFADQLGNVPLAEMVLDADGSELAAAMERSANQVGATDIKFFSQRGYFARRILDDMGLRDLERLIASLRRSGEGDEDGEGDAARDLAQRLEQGRRYLLDESRQYVERQYELYARANGENLREEFLMETRMSNLEHRDFDRMHRIVRRMAKRLASRYSHRRKHTRRGQLDIRRTMRRNMPHDGIPFEVLWKQIKIERPKIVVICDVSKSVAAAARFLLLFLYSLHEVIAHLEAYAFSDGLISVGEILEQNDVEQAIPEIMNAIGFRSTDYGQALADYEEGFMETLDRHTTVIILGDGRSNFTDPRIDIMRRIHDQSRSVIWLNPEPQTFWGTGDSEMPRYRQFCHVAKTCSTVLHLERVVDDILKSYARA
ncbi:MAG: VWA domain-containing protein [Alphaproteobacteria bacterium]|nr:VWA domain-containing protein [Alphaproteobacteria bacterium]